MSNLADSGSNDSDSNGEFEQLLPPVSIPPQSSTQPPSTPSERGETNLSVSSRASPPVTPTPSMSSETTYLQSELGASSKREADSSAQAGCGCCCFSACVTNMDPRVKDVLQWKCPCRSVIVFLAGLVLLFTVQMCSAFEVLGYLGFALLIVGGAGKLVRMILGPPPSTQPTPSSSAEGCTGCPASGASCSVAECKRSLVAHLGCMEQSKWEVSEQCAKETLERALPHVNRALAHLKSVFLLTDTIKAIKFGVICWLLLYLGSWFDLLTLLQIVWVALFSLPKVYTLYQVQIDNVLNEAKGFTLKYWEQAKSKIPGAAKQKAQ